MLPLTSSDLAMVILVRDNQDARHRPMPILGIREIGAAVRDLTAHGVHSVKVFASDDRRDATGSGGKALDSLMARSIREVKAADPSMTVMTETCLCSYTDTGECHITGRAGNPDRIATLDALAEQAVAQAEAGADVVGPAAMLDGSVSRVRQALDDTGHSDVAIMPHLIFHSRLYDGYRRTMDAIPASGDRRVSQLDPTRPKNAVRISLRFISEGANMLLLEPALFCADILIALKQECDVPLAPFSVSGEYTRLASGDGDRRLLIELFTMLKRAGADQIITYAAADLARVLT